MALRSQTRSRRKIVKRSGGRKMRIMRRIKGRGGPAQPIQYFKRTLYSVGAFTNATGAETFQGIQFTLSGVPNAAEFTSLYDQYCIKGIKYQLIPRVSEADMASQGMPNIGSAIDQDDAGVPTAITDLTQYQNFRLTRGNRTHSRYFKPAIANEVFGGGVLTAYGPKKNVWIDCNSSAVPHYGLKFFIQRSPVTVSFDVKIDFYLAFKNVR